MGLFQGSGGEIDLGKLRSITTDGAPSMVGREKRLFTTEKRTCSPWLFFLIAALFTRDSSAASWGAVKFMDLLPVIREFITKKKGVDWHNQGSKHPPFKSQQSSACISEWCFGFQTEALSLPTLAWCIWFHALHAQHRASFEPEICVVYLDGLSNEFENQFTDQKVIMPMICLVKNPYSIDVIQVSKYCNTLAFQEGLLKETHWIGKNNNTLKQQHKEEPLVDFWRHFVSYNTLFMQRRFWHVSGARGTCYLTSIQAYDITFVLECSCFIIRRVAVGQWCGSGYITFNDTGSIRVCYISLNHTWMGKFLGFSKHLRTEKASWIRCETSSRSPRTSSVTLNQLILTQ